MADESDEPEVIRQQMDASRTALVEKIELLEERVAETVQNATASVTETVDSVKGAVQGTVDAVRHSVEDTVSSVSEALDLPLQANRHPWAMFMGAVAAGYVGAQLFPGGERGPRFDPKREISPTFDRLAVERAEAEGMGATATSKPAAIPHTSAPERAGHAGLTCLLSDTFQSEIATLKGLAVGTVFGMVRDMLVGAGPASLKPDIVEVIDRVTEKLGGHPIKGSVLSEGRIDR